MARLVHRINAVPKAKVGPTRKYQCAPNEVASESNSGIKGNEISQQNRDFFCNSPKSNNLTLNAKHTPFEGHCISNKFALQHYLYHTYGIS